MHNGDSRIKTFKKRKPKTLLLFLITAVFTFYIKTVPVAEAEIYTGDEPLQKEELSSANLTDSEYTEISWENVQQLKVSKIYKAVKAAKEKTKTSPLVIIDPGHGGEDAGSIAGDIMEKDLNISIALKIESELNKLGYRVLLLRHDDSFLDKYERADIANKTGGAALISIHQNSFDDSKVSGTETWYGGANESSKTLAELIHKKILSATGSIDRGCVYDKNLVMTNYTKMPSCLVEIGFMSNSTELAKISSDDFQASFARSMAEGIDLFFKPKVMYLTFDDGPTKHTATILDILKEKNIKATFFVIGDNVRKYPELMQRIVKEGHTIGIHSQSHEYKKIYASADSYLSDFYEAQETVFEVTGARPTLYRFPGGSINSYNKRTNKAIIEEMTKLGFTYFDWNAEFGDGVRNPEHKKIVETAQKSVGSKARVVMLAHDNKSASADALLEVIELFPDYLMEPITTETKAVQFGSH